MTVKQDKMTAAATTLNARLSGLGLKLIQREFNSGSNALGMADWQVLPACYNKHIRDEHSATVFLVESAWFEWEERKRKRPANAALYFLKEYAPETYVRAIYAAHGSEQTVTVLNRQPKD